MPKSLGVFGLVLLFYGVFLSPPVFGVDYFRDDFSGDLSKWEIAVGDTSWNIASGQLVGEIGWHGSTFIYAKNTYGLSDYELTADVMNTAGIDQHFLFRVAQDKSSYYLVELRYGDADWPQDGNSIRLWRYGGGYSLVTPDTPYNMVQNVFHKFKLVVEGLRIKVYVDGNLLMDIVDSQQDGILSGGVGLQNYAGDYFYRPVRNVFDNIVISSISAGSGVGHKIIILPGLGASWSAGAMVYGQQVGDDQWQMTPFVKNYDGLVAALEGKGLVRNQDFWIWNYDWRRPISEIVAKLDNFIEGKVGAGEKVDLVGHSLGGMVARVWGQENTTEPRLGKIISLGSPHQGAVKAYEVWSGAKIADGPDMGSIALNVLLQLQRKNYQTRVEAVRNFVPVLKDILPTFDFVKRNGGVVGVASLESQNSYLAIKNLTAGVIYDYFKAMVGMGLGTKEWANLGERSVFDRILGYWPDGKPISYEYGEGDVTVLKKSAKFEGDSFEEVAADHQAIVDRAIPNILAELGLGGGAAGSGDYDLTDYLVFYLGSPATMRVRCDDGGEIADELGWVVIKDVGYQQCRIGLEGTTGGIYHLVMGRSDEENSWRYLEDEIGAGETKTVVIDGQKIDLAAEEGNLDYLYELVRRDANYLLGIYQGDVNLNGVLVGIERRDLAIILNKLFAFRKARREAIISERMLENIKLILAINNLGTERVVAGNMLTKITRLKNLVDRNTTVMLRRRRLPGSFESLSYFYLEKLAAEAGQKFDGGEYGGVAADEILVSRLYGEIW